VAGVGDFQTRIGLIPGLPADGEAVGCGDLCRSHRLDGEPNRGLTATAGLPGIGDEVDDHQLQLVRIRVDHGPRCGQIGLQDHGSRRGGSEHRQASTTGL
jgi:hypothetical protein